MIFNKLKALCILGIDAGFHHSDTVSRRIYLTNQISILLFFVAAQYIFVFSIMGHPELLGFVFFTLFLFSSSLYLSYKKHFFLSKLNIVFSTNIVILFFSCVFGKESGVQYVYFSLLILPFCIFSPKRKYVVLFSSLSFVASYYLLYIFDFCFFDKVVTNSIYQTFMFYSASISIFLMSFLFLIFYFRASEEAEKRLALANSLLQETNKQIIKVNENLEQSEKRLDMAFHKNIKESEDLQKQAAAHVAYAEVVDGVAHELFNPMQLIRGRAELMTTKKDVNEEILKFSNSIVRSIDRLDAILKPMLTYGRKTSLMNPVSFKLHELLSDLYEISVGSFKKKGLSFNLDCEENMTCYADKSYIFQALVNLVVNAQQHTSRGGALDICVEESEYLDPKQQLREGVCIFLKDNGEGIEKEELESIFVPYVSAKKEVSNIGLGLAIVFKAITQSEGHLAVDSKKGKGTTFRLYLPKHPAIDRTLQKDKLNYYEKG
ncbi:hypothetical protein HOG98_03350 [bacterium]|nr:hypothetical protein [bacterium]